MNFIMSTSDWVYTHECRSCWRLEVLGSLDLELQL